MNRAVGSFVVAFFGGSAAIAWAQDAVFEVTLEVLDDVGGIEGVLMPIDEGSQPAEVESPPPERDEQQVPDSEHEARERTDLESELDKGEDSEGETEDLDVPEDLEPAPLAEPTEID
jgi:hypothetical protein